MKNTKDCSSYAPLDHRSSLLAMVLQEVTEVYKRLLLEHRDFLALNVYLALCYSKLDYFDVNSEMLDGYLQQYADSAAAINLKACNLFKLYTGKAAEAEIKVQHSAILLQTPILHSTVFSYVELKTVEPFELKYRNRHNSGKIECVDRHAVTHVLHTENKIILFRKPPELTRDMAEAILGLR